MRKRLWRVLITMFILSVTGSSAGSSPVPAAPAESALFGVDFPGSAGVTFTVRFRFTNPLPIYPATYIWRAYPREQPSNWPVTQPCRLPAATIAIFRLGGTASVPVNQSDFLAPADSGSNFRIDSTNCQYRYNL